MPRYIVIICVLIFAVASQASAQHYQEVVYLKNGSIVRGIIVEQIPGESLKIQVQGGSLFVFKMSEVLKIVKEPIIVPTAIKGEKSPALAFAFSFLLVGTGQAYNEEYTKAIGHWFFLSTSIFLIYKGGEDNVRVYTGRSFDSVDPDRDNILITAGVGMLLINWVVSMIQAPISAQKINEQRRNSQGLSILDDRLMLEPYTSREKRGAMLSLRF